MPAEQFSDVVVGEIRQMGRDKSVQALVEAGLKGSGASANGARPVSIQ